MSTYKMGNTGKVSYGRIVSNTGRNLPHFVEIADPDSVQSQGRTNDPHQPQVLSGLAYDYTNQAWLKDGRYVSCGHPEAMNCKCFGRIHAGESPAAKAEIH